MNLFDKTDEIVKGNDKEVEGYVKEGNKISYHYVVR